MKRLVCEGQEDLGAFELTPGAWGKSWLEAGRPGVQGAAAAPDLFPPVCDMHALTPGSGDMVSQLR